MLLMFWLNFPTQNIKLFAIICDSSWWSACGIQWIIKDGILLQIHPLILLIETRCCVGVESGSEKLHSVRRYHLQWLKKKHLDRHDSKEHKPCWDWRNIGDLATHTIKLHLLLHVHKHTKYIAFCSSAFFF